MTQIQEGVYRFSTCSRVGHRKNQSRKSYEGQIDYFFAYNPKDDVYLVLPIDKTGKTEKTVRSRLYKLKKGYEHNVTYLEDYAWF